MFPFWHSQFWQVLVSMQKNADSWKNFGSKLAQRRTNCYASLMPKGFRTAIQKDDEKSIKKVSNKHRVNSLWNYPCGSVRGHELQHSKRAERQHWVDCVGKEPEELRVRGGDSDKYFQGDWDCYHEQFDIFFRQLLADWHSILYCLSLLPDRRACETKRAQKKICWKGGPTQTGRIKQESLITA